MQAYAASPNAIRAHLETLILQINAEVLDAQDALRAGTDGETCTRIARLATDEIKPLIGAASGAIHGRIDGEDNFCDDTAQADVDALFG